MQSDSLDKIITRYIATVARVSFEYGGKVYVPKILKVSHLLLRDYTCPPQCGGCCFRFTLDYLPDEKRPKEGMKQRIIQVNKMDFVIWTDGQEENEGKRCKYLQSDGRCGTYLVRPFTCDFELIRTLQNEEVVGRPNVLTQKLFGRGWSYERTDGGKGAKCEMLPITTKSTKEVVRKLLRLMEWSDYFEIDTWLPDIIDIIRDGRLTHQLVFTPPNLQTKGFGF